MRIDNNLHKFFNIIIICLIVIFFVFISGLYFLEIKSLNNQSAMLISYEVSTLKHQLRNKINNIGSTIKNEIQEKRTYLIENGKLDKNQLDSLLSCNQNTLKDYLSKIYILNKDYKIIHSINYRGKQIDSNKLQKEVFNQETFERYSNDINKYFTIFKD